MGFRKWLYDLLFTPAAVRTVTMTEAQWRKEKVERRLWEERKYGLDSTEMRKDDG